MKVKDLALEIGRKLNPCLGEIIRDLGYPIPLHHEVRASLLYANGRKISGNVSANNWSPKTGRIRIHLVAQEGGQQSAEVDHTNANIPPAQPREFSGGVSNLNRAEADLLKALDRAEARPGWSFVPLKKFRDEILPLEKFASMRTEVERRKALDSVIKRKFVLTDRVANPRSPQFPVTTIRLNRLMAEVRAALGLSGNPDLEFRPVEIRGEPLSTTILRERR